VSAANVGLACKFVNVGTGAMIIQTSDSDTIDVSAAGGYAYTTSQYGTAEIMLASETEWVVLSKHGTWVVV
jgi:hypothetical protein